MKSSRSTLAGSALRRSTMPSQGKCQKGSPTNLFERQTPQLAVNRPVIRLHASSPPDGRQRSGMSKRCFCPFSVRCVYFYTRAAVRGDGQNLISAIPRATRLQESNHAQASQLLPTRSLLMNSSQSCRHRAAPREATRHRQTRRKPEDGLVGSLAPGWYSAESFVANAKKI